ILKQHQFHALCGSRGWKNTLRLMVDDEFPPPSLLLPVWGLRAEFWVEGAADDINDTGTFLYLTTDQVRFYSAEAAKNTAHATGHGYRSRGADEPVRLEAVPAMVLSEVMRDIDLFVGVSSIGNDPEWFDGGPQGRYRDYWEHYSFGELGELSA